MDSLMGLGSDVANTGYTTTGQFAGKNGFDCVLASVCEEYYNCLVQEGMRACVCVCVCVCVGCEHACVWCEQECEMRRRTLWGCMRKCV